MTDREKMRELYEMQKKAMRGAFLPNPDVALDEIRAASVKNRANDQFKQAAKLLAKTIRNAATKEQVRHCRRTIRFEFGVTNYEQIIQAVEVILND